MKCNTAGARFKNEDLGAIVEITGGNRGGYLEFKCVENTGHHYSLGCNYYSDDNWDEKYWEFLGYAKPKGFLDLYDRLLC